MDIENVGNKPNIEHATNPKQNKKAEVNNVDNQVFFATSLGVTYNKNNNKSKTICSPNRYKCII